MNLNYKFSLVVIVSLLISSCATTRFTNLYRTIEYSGVISNAIDVNVTAMPLPNPERVKKEKPKTFFDLHDSIPHVFLKVIGEKASDETEIIEAIKAPLSIVEESPKESRKSDNDLTEISVRLLFSNIKKYFNHEGLLHPGTRTEFLNTYIKVISPNDLYLYNIDRLETEFESIDMGTLERSNSVDFSTGLSGEATGTISSETGSASAESSSDESGNTDTQNVYDANGNLLGTISNLGKNISLAKNEESMKNSASATKGAKAEIKYSSNDVIKEALKINYKRLKTGFSFTTKDLTVSQRGKPLSDISDNVFVTATLKFDQSQVRTTSNVLTFFSDLYNNQMPQKADDIKFSQYSYRTIYCKNADDIKLDISHEGLIRAVKTEGNGRNVLEFDDKVEFYKFNNGTTPKNIIIPKQYYCENLFYIAADNGGNTDFILKIKPAAVPKSTLLMHLDDDPEAIIEWIREHLNNPVAASLQTNKVVLIFEKTGAPAVPLVQSTMNAADIANLQNFTNIRLVNR